MRTLREAGLTSWNGSPAALLDAPSSALSPDTAKQVCLPACEQVERIRVKTALAPMRVTDDRVCLKLRFGPCRAPVWT